LGRETALQPTSGHCARSPGVTAPRHAELATQAGSIFGFALLQASCGLELRRCILGRFLTIGRDCRRCVLKQNKKKVQLQPQHADVAPRQILLLRQGLRAEESAVGGCAGGSSNHCTLSLEVKRCIYRRFWRFGRDCEREILIFFLMLIFH
jgi:hypothetical protein